MGESIKQRQVGMLIKKEVILEGTLLLKESPFVYILSSKYRTDYCDFCFRKSNELLKCSNCKYVYYCGRPCQKEGWSLHRWECKNFKKISPKLLPDAARLLYRLHKILENGGSTKKSYYTEKDYRTYKDLMSHYPELKKDQRRMEHLSSLYGVLYEFCDNMLPNSAEFMGIYGRMCINSFNICNQELQSLGTGIYLAASIIDHSCEPNALAVFEGTTLYVRSLEKMSCLDWSKVRISYIDVMGSTEDRLRELQKTYYFLCDCVKCIEPECVDDMYGAACPNPKCNSSINMNNNPTQCIKCGTVVTQDFANNFKDVLEFTEMHLDTMKQTTLCLKRHQQVLFKFHLKHVKVLDLAFESAIDLGLFDEALQYGLELIEAYRKYYPEIHPLRGLLHLKLCKLLLYEGKVTEGINHLKSGTQILKITHGSSSSLYKSEVLPLMQQCRCILNGVK
ncbi:histone-lysine N-methyltransferase SMYD3-like isoform X2 [Cylas formicarius]|uniref:histone-lysine N-methyltransferase SMYD3-like isoform X2 n=1 Tax=Cylas formicarius TaxID=197179 RepID=UPI00295860F2|nr:histone-lysine N-methyltransferase SMYD3-like isoform X2 [Cylas formicarius]